MPLLHKILLANAAVVALGAVAGTAVSVQVGRSLTGTSTLILASAFAAVGLVLSLVVNALLVRWLLAPLERLEKAAARIQDGAEPREEEIAVPPAADPSLERLVRVFNGMLRSLARHRARLRTVAAQSIRAGEEDRLRISRTLQEDAAQQVASCLVRLRWARDLDEEERERALDKVRDHLSDALEAVRRLARSLRPPELDDIGLDSALRALAREVREQGELDVQIECPDGPPDLSSERRLLIYRAAHAAVRACHHNERATLRLTVRPSDGFVVLDLRAQDRVLPLAASLDHLSADIELFAVRERLRLAGGGMSFVPGPEGDARGIRIRVPAGRGELEPDRTRASRNAGDSPSVERSTNLTTDQERHP